MPFATSTSNLVGEKLRAKPHYGFGWRLVNESRILREFEVPEAFDFTLKHVLFHESEARVLIGAVDVVFGEDRFFWLALIARTDLFIDFLERSVDCNMLIANSEPSISKEFPYGDPRFVSPNSDPHVRGFGRISLLR